MYVIRNKKIFFIISTVLVVFSLFSIFFWGLNPGIEFTGGSITEVSYPNERPELTQIHVGMSTLQFGDVLVQPTGDDGYIVKTKELNTEERSALFGVLSLQGEAELVEERYNLVGPSIGRELRTKAWIAIVAVIAAIILFIAFAFRRVSGTVLSNVETGIRSWHYGVIAIVALAHDIIIPTGIFAFLGSMFVDAQIDVLLYNL